MPTTDEDIAYYRRRIDACTEQAMRAETPAARHAHETLARLYREKLAALGAGPSGHGGEEAATLAALRPDIAEDAFSADIYADKGREARP